MECGRGRGDRDGSASAGGLHADEGFPSRFRGFRGEKEAGIRRRLMDRFEHYGWPFFEARHRKLALDADAWVQKKLVEDENADSVCRHFVKELGKAGFLEHCVS